jgi:hypothetical protein
MPEALLAKQSDLQAKGRSMHSARSLCLLLIGVPIVGLLSSFFIERTSFFQKYCQTNWVLSGESIFGAKGAHCDIAVYGDSIAVVGLDPDLIEQATHLRTCNIAESQGASAVLGTDPLDRFLANNDKPAFLVLLYSPPDYRFRKWEDAPYIEGVILLSNFYPSSTLFRWATRHPDSVIGMAHYVYVTGARNAWQRIRHDAPLSHPNALNAHFALPFPPLTRCISLSDVNLDSDLPDPQWIKSLRARYAAKADHLILDVAPAESSCNPRFTQIGGIVNGLMDNQYEELPVSYFVDRGGHPSKQGTNYLSAEIAQQVLTTQAKTLLASQAVIGKTNP